MTPTAHAATPTGASGTASLVATASEIRCLLEAVLDHTATNTHEIEQIPALGHLLVEVTDTQPGGPTLFLAGSDRRTLGVARHDVDAKPGTAFTAAIPAAAVRAALHAIDDIDPGELAVSLSPYSLSLVRMKPPYATWYVPASRGIEGYDWRQVLAAAMARRPGLPVDGIGIEPGYLGRFDAAHRYHGPMVLRTYPLPYPRPYPVLITCGQSFIGVAMPASHEQADRDDAVEAIGTWQAICTQPNQPDRHATGAAA